jgi:4-aminobutyrate aminotransferase-like enzyme
MESPHEVLLWRPLHDDEPLELVRGDGRHVVDGEGRTYLDFFGGIRTTSAGHNVPEVVEACRREGLLIGIGGLRGDVLRIAPAMSVTMEEAAQAVEVLAGPLAAADEEFAGRG